jgi:GxxExxY protein
MNENEIAKIIVDVAYKIHVALGPGLLESAYEIVMEHELLKRGLAIRRQVDVPIEYDGIKIETAFRADLIVNDLVIIELKSVEQIHPVHAKQLLTYLKLTNKKLGLLINFNVPLIKNGITRIVNGLPE